MLRSKTGGILEPFLDVPSLNLEARDSRGRTLILAACSDSERCFHYDEEESKYASSRPTAATLLVARGADIGAVDIGAVDKSGRNVLHCLLEHCGSPENVLKNLELFSSTASGSALAVQRDAVGATPLHYALKFKSIYALDCLLGQGADPLEPDPNGDTALHHIAGELSSQDTALDQFKNFLSLGVPINARNSLGETPLFAYIARSAKYQEHLSLFTDAGADLLVRNKKGQSLLHVIASKKPAWRNRRRRIVGDNPEVDNFEYLMEKGLDPMSEDDEQRTPLDMAAASGSKEILELFRRKA